MKKLTTLLLAAGLVVSSYAGASAGEFVPNAQFINQYVFGDGGQALDGSKAMTDQDDNFVAQLRLRLGFDYVASETLSGTFLFEVGVYEYGQTGATQLDNSMGGMDEASNFEVRLAYVDWMVPNTDVSVRMGMQPFAMPAFAFGSAVLDGRGSGITVAAPINENIDLTAAWLRVEHADGSNGHHNDYDAFALIADFNYDGFRVAPWAMYAMKGKETGLNMYNVMPFTSSAAAYQVADTEMNAWWLGASFELSMFDPFMFALDAYYSDADFDATGTAVNGGKDFDMNGFYVGASASYKTSNGTPALKAWYASGNDYSAGSGYELRQPAVLVGGFNATSIMFGDQVMDTDGYSDLGYYNPAGTWGVLLEWADFSFVEKLSHTARIAYIKGTNDDEGVGFDAFSQNGSLLGYLTSKDDVVEVNFNSSYEIYKNFVATLELGWLTADFGRRNGVSITEALGKDADDDIFRSALSFKYTF